MNKIAEFVEQYLPERYLASCDPNGVSENPVVLGLSVTGAGTWSLIAHADHLQVEQHLTAHRVLTVSSSEADFEHLVLAHKALLEESSPMIAPKMLRWDDETRGLVTAMPGSILVRIGDQAQVRRILLTPGTLATDFESAQCTIDCELSDLLAVRSGAQQAMELFLAGKLRIDGDVQLALALAGILM